MNGSHKQSNRINLNFKVLKGQWETSTENDNLLGYRRLYCMH